MEPEEYRRMFELEDRYWWFLAKRKLVRMLIQEHVPRRPAVAVDVGCGTGGTLAALAGEADRWIGMDQSALALGFCRRRGLSSLTRSSIEAFPLRSGCVDLLLCLDVLYHRAVRDDRRALEECFRALAPGGTVIITDSALNWLRGPHDAAVHTRQRYGLGEIVTMVRDAGFEVVKSSYANSLIFLPTVIFRLARRWFPGEGTKSDVVDVPRPLQRLLGGVQGVERWVLKRISLPIGTTVVVVGRKP